MDRPELIASDVDGTLLDPLERITRRTFDAVSRVTRSNTPFILVSGRPPRWIPNVAQAAGLTGYAVCSNGGVVYDIAADRVVSSQDIDPILLRDTAKALSAALPDARLATERVAPDLVPFVTQAGFRNPWGVPNGELDGEVNDVPLAEVIGHAATKLMVRQHDLTSRELAAAAHDVLAGAAVEITFSTNQGLIEIAPAGVTKASGLAEVCALLGVDRDRVVAFGDMPNDLPMLDWAGHGVAMANANAEVLAVADEVTATNGEDGVAQVLERWF
ncbi:HAD family hydrolase [Actinophytocola xinjiangensis]|uniref:HAD family hydrolase n=1 Tax=Actinophytocola xinjiangensis TaxID=485602 RepID=A0A7Z0WIQ5_9PSEU|nr:HAD family hydrolase [Actinophytocola xinjiangensis]OLF07591.1 HAD family hydrolase [Actinophytocola xinjiangensis]